MKKLMVILLLAGLSLSTFSAVAQQDTTSKQQKQKVKTKSKKSPYPVKRGMVRRDTIKRDSLPDFPVRKDTLHQN